MQPGAARKVRLDPARRGARGNADAIILAQEHDGHRRALKRGPRGGVNRAQRGRMVGRGIAKRAQHHTVFGEHRLFEPHPPRDPDGKCRAHRLGQMAGDGGGLRRDHQPPGAKHFVTPARNWIVRTRGERKQHIPSRGFAGHPPRAVDLKRSVAVMQKRHIIHAQRLGQRGIALMP